MKLNIPLWIGIPFVLLGLLMALALRPVPSPSLQNSTKVTGKLIALEESGGPGDVIMQLENNDVTFYINRGTERGVNPTIFQEQLLNQTITIYHAKHWTPLDPLNKTRHVYRIEFNDEILYDEIKR